MRKENRRTWKAVAVTLIFCICFMLAGCGGDDKIHAPFESKNHWSEDLNDIVEQLEAAGFTNIQKEPQETESESSADRIIKIKIGSNTMWNTANAWRADVPIIIEYYEYTGIRHIDVTMDVAVDGEDGKPVFSILTNLPDGTTLNVEFASETDDTDFYYEQRELTVEGGAAQTEAFTADGEPLVGTYSFGVVMLPEEQTEQVQEITGVAGEALQGSFVENSGDYSYIVKSVEYVSPVEKTVEKISEEEMLERLETAVSSIGDDCEISVEGYVYTINTWHDGLAMTAVMAQLGDEEAVEAWDGIAYATMEASERLQELLEMSGYGEYMAQMQVLNDENHDNTLLTASMGLVTYNCVS